MLQAYAQTQCSSVVYIWLVVFLPPAFLLTRFIVSIYDMIFLESTGGNVPQIFRCNYSSVSERLRSCGVLWDIVLYCSKNRLSFCLHGRFWISAAFRAFLEHFMKRWACALSWGHNGVDNLVLYHKFLSSVISQCYWIVGLYLREGHRGLQTFLLIVLLLI